MKDSFVLHNSFYTPIKSLSIEEKGQLLDAIFQYHISGESLELPPVCKMAFDFMKGQFDRDTAKYEAACERNRMNGSKGGRPPKQKETGGLLKKPNKPNGYLENPPKPKKPDNDNEYDNEYDNGNDIRSSKFNFKNELLKLGVQKQIAADWMKVRKQKKATNTETAFNALKAEFAKSGLTANECVKIATERSWGGFRAEWDHASKTGQTKGQILQDAEYKSKIEF